MVKTRTLAHWSTSSTFAAQSANIGTEVPNRSAKSSSVCDRVQKKQMGARRFEHYPQTLTCMSLRHG